MNLYEEKSIEKYTELLEEKKTFMAYCPECGAESAFKRSKWFEKRLEKIEDYRCAIPVLTFNSIDEAKKLAKLEKANRIFDYDDNFLDEEFREIVDMGNGYLYIEEYECCIKNSHRRYNIYYLKENTFVKIGQYPSAYDNGSQEYLNKLKAVCGSSKANEMSRYIKKALIMESFGYGIPALVYMRRAFEQLIYISEDKNELKNTGEKMADRIKNNPLLPKDIKENKRIYNVISEGIHNQSEEECMELFKLIKVGFTILLRKTYEHVQEQKDLEELSKLVSSK